MTDPLDPRESWLVSPPRWLRWAGAPLRRQPWLWRRVQRARLFLLERRLCERSVDLGVDTLPHTIQVAPADLELAVQRPDADKWADRQQVADGDWDLATVAFADLDIHLAMRERAERDLPWEQTAFHTRVLRQIESGDRKWNCGNREDLEARCHDIDRLFADIRDHGYRSQAELPGPRGTPLELHDEVSVCIDRYGHLLFDDGRHRLAAAKILEIDRIPVQVTLRHTRWAQLIREIGDYADRHEGCVYAPLMHPDLEHVPYLHGHERFELIHAAVPMAAGASLLDLGAHWGYFCHRFERLGLTCTAVESDLNHLRLMRRLREASSLGFRVHEGSMFDLPGGAGHDLVLALNVFHHLFASEGNRAQLAALLGRLRAPRMVLQTPAEGDPHVPSGSNAPNPQELLEFVQRHTGLATSVLLGVAEDARPLFLLEPGPDS